MKGIYPSTPSALNVWGFISPPVFSCLEMFAPTTIKKYSTSCHPPIHLYELPVLVESQSWTLLAPCDQSPHHYRTCTHRQSLRHVARVFIPSVRAQRNLVVLAHWRRVHQSRKLGNPASCHNSSDANATISNATANSICTRPDQMFCSLPCSD